MVEYNHCKKEELKCLNEQITKQDGIEHKPKPNMNTYVYVRAPSAFGLTIGGCFLYSKFKKPEQTLIDVPVPPVSKTSTEPKRELLTVHFPDLKENQVTIPGTTKLTFNISLAGTMSIGL